MCHVHNLRVIRAAAAGDSRYRLGRDDDIHTACPRNQRSPSQGAGAVAGAYPTDAQPMHDENTHSQYESLILVILTGLQLRQSAAWNTRHHGAPTPWSFLIHTHQSTVNPGHISHQQTLRDIKGLCHPRKNRWFPSEWPATRHVDRGGSRWWRCSRKSTMSSSPRIHMVITKLAPTIPHILQIQSGKCSGEMDGEKS